MKWNLKIHLTVDWTKIMKDYYLFVDERAESENYFLLDVDRLGLCRKMILECFDFILISFIAK